MNEDLNKKFTAEEVDKALMQMHLKKALGPNGMPLGFFQQYWHIVGKSITKVVLSALHIGEFPYEINHIFIILIPKKNQPIKVVAII